MPPDYKKMRLLEQIREQVVVIINYEKEIEQLEDDRQQLAERCSELYHALGLALAVFEVKDETGQHVFDEMLAVTRDISFVKFLGDEDGSMRSQQD